MTSPAPQPLPSPLQKQFDALMAGVYERLRREAKSHP